MKKAISTAPILRYYDAKKEAVLQCDASESGLGAVLMQAGQPVALASRAMKPLTVAMLK